MSVKADYQENSESFESLTGTVASRWLARFKLLPAGMKSQNVLTDTLLNEFFPLAMGPLLLTFTDRLCIAVYVKPAYNERAVWKRVILSSKWLAH